MATYVLIHGASSDSWYWHRVVPELEARGHACVTPDLPCDDDSAGVAEYADAVVTALDSATDGHDRASRGLIVVAQSLAGFTAPLACERVSVDLMVLVAAMIPAPHERLGDWWLNTGWERAHREQAEREGRTIGKEFDIEAEFLHDVPPDVAAELMARGERRQSSRPFQDVWPLERWPDVPTRFLLCRDDRFFPAPFLRRVVRERLGITPDEMDGGHLSALARPRELVERLEAYRIEYVGP